MGRVVSLAALLLLTTCGASDSGSSSGGGGTSGGGTGGAAGAGGGGGAAGAGGELWACALSFGCKPVDLHHYVDPPTKEETPETACFLTHLRDRQVGRYTIGNHYSDHDDLQYIELLADGTVLVLTIVVDGTGKQTWSTREHQALKDTSFFDGCLAIVDGFERYQCLTSFTAGPAAGDPKCP